MRSDHFRSALSCIGVDDEALAETNEFFGSERRCVEITATRTGLSLISSSALSFSSKTTIAAQVERTGTITVPAQALNKLARLAEDPLLVWSDSDADLVAETGGARTRLRAVSESPLHPPAMDEPSSVLAPADLQNLGRILFASNPKSSTACLRGIYFGDHEAVCLDNRRLAKIAPFNIEANVVVPRESVAHILRVSADNGCDLAVGTQWVVFCSNGTIWAALQMGMPFPNYGKLFDKRPTGFIRAPVRRLIDALERLTIVQAPHSAVNISASLSGSIVLDSYFEDVGSVYVELSGEATFLDTICVNGACLREALQEVRGGTVTLELTGALQPVIIREPPFMTALMPLATPRTRGP